MEQWQAIASIIGVVVVSTGVLWGIVRWAVSSALAPFREDMTALRNDVTALRTEVQADFRRTGERLARVEATIEATTSRLDRIEVHGAISGQRVEARYDTRK